MIIDLKSIIIIRKQLKSSLLNADAIDDPNVSYTTAVVEADDSGSEQIPVETSDIIGQQHVALVTQEDGTQQQVMEMLNAIPR